MLVRENTVSSSLSKVLSKLRVEQASLNNQLQNRLQLRVREVRRTQNNKPLIFTGVTLFLLGVFVMIMGKESKDSLGTGGGIALFGLILFLCVLSPKNFYKIFDALLRCCSSHDLPHLNIEERQRISAITLEIKPIAEENHVRISIRPEDNLLSLKDQLDGAEYRLQALEDINFARKERNHNEGKVFLANLNLLFARGQSGAPVPVVDLVLEYLDAAELKR